MKKLKDKWGISSNFQFIIILIVFSITGSLSLYVTKPLLNLIGINKEAISIWLFYPLKIVIVFPTYQVLILIIGFIFGQFNFFWAFEKKMLARMGLKKFKDKK